VAATAPVSLSAFCLAAGLACAQQSDIPAGEDAPDAALTLEFLAMTTIPAHDPTHGVVGGISGLDGDIAVSDGARPSLLLSVEVTLTDDDELRVQLAPHRDAVEIDASDAEAIARDPIPWRVGDRMFIALENPPRLLQHWSTRGVPSPMALPEEILRHARPNRSFEALACRMVDHRLELWAGMESSLTIDGPEATEEQGALCRVLVFTGRTNLELARQSFYRTESRPKSIIDAKAQHGLVEFAALPDGRILALERSLTIPRAYQACIFVLDGTVREEVGIELPVLNKTRLASMSDLGLHVIGNLEAMALGPTIASLTGNPNDTGRLLLLIADDNFGADGQKGSQVIALRLVGLE
jgi:hypothetical protein